MIAGLLVAVPKALLCPYKRGQVTRRSILPGWPGKLPYPADRVKAFWNALLARRAGMWTVRCPGTVVKGAVKAFLRQQKAFRSGGKGFRPHGTAFRIHGTAFLHRGKGFRSDERAFLHRETAFR